MTLADYSSRYVVLYRFSYYKDYHIFVYVNYSALKLPNLK